MSATFLIRIDVPDPRRAHDASLEAAGESVFQYGLGLDAEISGENRLTELLSNSDYDGHARYSKILDGWKGSKCWLANSGTSSPHGLVTPQKHRHCTSISN